MGIPLDGTQMVGVERLPEGVSKEEREYRLAMRERPELGGHRKERWKMSRNTAWRRANNRSWAVAGRNTEIFVKNLLGAPMIRRSPEGAPENIFDIYWQPYGIWL